MLPDIDLDSERFDDILENAKNRIISTYPQWTDLNYHDPGMTMLEMFAWLKEIQQYYLNRIGPDNISKYFKLLGITRQTKKPSSTQVTVKYSEDMVAAAGTRLYAGDICFEADRRTYISSAEIICCISKSQSGETIFDRSVLDFGGNLRIIPFPAGNNGDFYIGFDKPLKNGEDHMLYIELTGQSGFSRNPITDPDSFIPLVDISAEYFNGITWQSMDCTDGTFGFLSSGVVVMKPKSPHAKCTVGGINAYFIRFRLSGGEYDVIPTIRSLEFRLLPVTQRETCAEYHDMPVSGHILLDTELSVTGITRVYLKDVEGLYTAVSRYEKKINEEGTVTLVLHDTGKAKAVRVVNLENDFLGESEIAFGTGLPFQEYELSTNQLEYESFSLMTELPASGGKFVEWKKVPDFSTSGAEDFVYILDTSTGRIKFGNCIRGMAPEGRIFIIGCSRTFGSDGNVSVGMINRMDNMDDSEITISNLRRSEKGQDEETIENCCLRAHLLLRSTETIVTDEDCERFVSSVQGLSIEKCQLISDPSMSDGHYRSIIVKPYSPDGKGVPNDRYKKNILAALEKRRMLGTGYRIVDPEYSAVRVYASVTVDKTYSDARERIYEVINTFFGGYKNHFGAKLIYSRLYEMLDRLSFVISVNTLTLETNGSGAQRTREGDLMLSSNVMAYLSDIELFLTKKY